MSPSHLPSPAAHIKKSRRKCIANKVWYWRRLLRLIWDVRGIISVSVDSCLSVHQWHIKCKCNLLFNFRLLQALLWFIFSPEKQSSIAKLHFISSTLNLTFLSRRNTTSKWKNSIIYPFNFSAHATISSSLKAASCFLLSISDDVCF